MALLDQHKEAISEALNEGASQREIARRFDVSRDTVKRFLANNDLDAKPRLRLVEDTGPKDGPTRLEMLEAEVKELRSRDRVIRSIDVANERVIETIGDAIGAGYDVRFEPLPKLGAEHKPHVQVLLLSDLHAGEVVVPEAMDGLNDFNFAILVERMERIFESLLSFKDTRSYPIEELQLWLLGDMCSGANHQEIAETNEFPQAVQAKLVGELLAQFIERLVPHYPKLVLYGVSGNHPRTSKAPAAKQVFDNWDWMAYTLAEAYLRQYIDEGLIEVHFPQSGFVVAETAGLNHLLWHGDGVRSTMVGFPGGGVTRRARELKAQWMNKGVILNGVACGHFHSVHVIPGGIYVNGSVKGPDEWCLKQYGYGDAPEQLLLTFDPRKHRRTEVSSINP